MAAKGTRRNEPTRPRGFKEFVGKDEIVDLLLERGYCCENQKIDFSDCREILGWAPATTRFKLILVNPRRLTNCVMPAKRFKPWPCVFGFGEGVDGQDYSIVDGLHRCAAANWRGYSGVWAYVPAKEDGSLHDWASFEAFETADRRAPAAA